MSDLHKIALQLVATPKGIIAMDESTSSCEKRFVAVGISCTEETRRQYRQIFVHAHAGKYIGGAILYKETLYQKADDGTPFVGVLRKDGILPGIKVDGGLEPQESGEQLTKGLTALSEDLPKYRAAGAAFAKWRALFPITDAIPTHKNIVENAKRLAHYAKACQENGIVPIVEPEILFEGSHTIERSEEVSRDVLTTLFAELAHAHVDLKGLILKPSMVTPGEKALKVPAAQVADATIAVLTDCVPKEVPGIAFLSGGIADDDCTAYLSAMHQRHPKLPWRVTFSFSRGLQRTALVAFAKGDIKGAKAAYLERAKACSNASVGK